MLFILHSIKLLLQQNKVYREVPTSAFNCLNNCYSPKRLRSKIWNVKYSAACGASGYCWIGFWCSERYANSLRVGLTGPPNPFAQKRGWGTERLTLLFSSTILNNFSVVSDSLPTASRDKKSGGMSWVLKVSSIIRWPRARGFSVCVWPVQETKKRDRQS